MSLSLVVLNNGKGPSTKSYVGNDLFGDWHNKMAHVVPPTTHPVLVMDDTDFPRATTLMYYCIGKHLPIAVLIIVSTQSA